MSGDEAVRKVAFTRIMAAIDMPSDTGPDYDEWLFNKAWQASRSAAIQECAEAVKESIGYGRRELAEKLLAMKEK